MTTYWSHPLLLQFLLFNKLTMCVDDFRHCGMVYYGDCIFSCDVQYKACITSMHSMSINKILHHNDLFKSSLNKYLLFYKKTTYSSMTVDLVIS